MNPSAQAAQILSGHDTCTGLTDLGRAQVGALNARLVRTGELGTVGAVYTSVLPRAQETARILAPALGGLDAHAECDWCEIHAGVAEGMRYEEMRAKYLPGARSGAGRTTGRSPTVRAGPTSTTGWAPGSSVPSPTTRARPSSWSATAAPSGRASWRSATSRCRRRPTSSTTCANASITEWVGSDGRCRLARFNDAAHLHDL